MKRYRPWLILAGVFLVWFGVFETLGFTDPDRYATLSNAVATLGKNWPPFIFLSGFVCGHFFWPWKKNPLGEGAG